MKRKAQFYLFAALVVSTIIVSLFSLYTLDYFKGSSHTKIYDLGSEIKHESEEVLDYGVFEGDDFETLMDNFSRSYSEYALEENMNFYFIFGNENKIVLINYGDDAGDEVSISPGRIALADFVKEHIPEEGQKSIKVKIKEKEYEFEINPGQNFYFILSQEVGDNEYIYTK